MISLATFSCLVLLYLFCTNLGHFDTSCATVFSFPPHNQHIGYTFSPNTLFRILLVFKAWSWADIIIFLVSFFQILFLQPVACCIFSDLIRYSLESPMGNFAFITTFMLLMNTFFFLSSFTWCFVLQNFSRKNSSSVDINNCPIISSRSPH